MVISKNWNEWDLYRFYNVRHAGWPFDLPSPPYPSHLQAFIFACVDAESRESEQQSKLRNRQQQASATRHPRSKFG